VLAEAIIGAAGTLGGSFLGALFAWLRFRHSVRAEVEKAQAKDRGEFYKHLSEELDSLRDQLTHHRHRERELERKLGEAERGHGDCLRRLTLLEIDVATLRAVKK